MQPRQLLSSMLVSLDVSEDLELKELMQPHTATFVIRKYCQLFAIGTEITIQLWHCGLLPPQTRRLKSVIAGLKTKKDELDD